MALFTCNFSFVYFIWAAFLAIHQTLWKEKLPFEFHFMSASHLLRDLSVKSRDQNKIIHILILLSMDDAVFIRLSSHHYSCVKFCLGTEQPEASKSKVCGSITSSPHQFPSPCSPQPCRDSSWIQRTVTKQWILDGFKNMHIFPQLKLLSKTKNWANLRKKIENRWKDMGFYDSKSQ